MTPDTTRSAIVCDNCHATVEELEATGHRGDCTARGRHQHHASMPIDQCLFYREWQEWTEQQQRIAARVAETIRRRQQRAEQRQQLAAARAAGLVRRHDEKLQGQP